MKRPALRRVRPLLIPAVIVSCMLLQGAAPAADVVAFEGTPREIGAAYGKMLGETIKRVVKDMITDDFGRDPEAYKNVLAGSRVMERFQPKEYIAELRAIAESAKVPYRDLLLLQYFGDVRRCIDGPGSSPLCTSFAILPPNTKGKVCIVGRNFDYFDNNVGEYASIIAYYRPRGKIPFVTVTWAGIINGWTLLNAEGLVVCNNTALGASSNSLEGISTCFLLRYLAENAKTVDAAIEMVKKLPRSCGTSLLIASGKKLDAAIVEFDHEAIAVRRPVDGFVGAGNGFMALRQAAPQQRYWGRIGTAHSLVQQQSGTIDINSKIAGADGVPIIFMNLHSAMIDATNLRLRVAMGKIPAYRLPYRSYRLTDKGVVAETTDEGEETSR
ncbi:MAG: hypothetical protein HQ592_05915 [Planctomycetes bacterium]|nr:hypothetical protein [Planctomycetota bacterium]